MGLVIKDLEIGYKNFVGKFFLDFLDLWRKDYEFFFGELVIFFLWVLLVILGELFGVMFELLGEEEFSVFLLVLLVVDVLLFFFFLVFLDFFFFKCMWYMVREMVLVRIYYRWIEIIFLVMYCMYLGRKKFKDVKKEENGEVFIVDEIGGGVLDFFFFSGLGIMLGSLFRIVNGVYGEGMVDLLKKSLWFFFYKFRKFGKNFLMEFLCLIFKFLMVEFVIVVFGISYEC